MKNHEQPDAVPVFFDALIGAVPELKNRLQQRYEQAYPDLGDIVRYVTDEEEANAWNLSSLFPHLVLPDLVEAHMRQLGLQLMSGTPEDMLAPPAFAEIQEYAVQAAGQIL